MRAAFPAGRTTLDASGRFSVAQVNLQEIMNAKTPEDNIQILSHDVISVPKAELVYVTGDVKKSGGYVLGERQTMSVLQAISLAEGLGPVHPTRGTAKILRLNPGATDERTEIPVDTEKKFSRVKAGTMLLARATISFLSPIVRVRKWHCVSWKQRYRPARVSRFIARKDSCKDAERDLAKFSILGRRAERQVLNV